MKQQILQGALDRIRAAFLAERAAHEAATAATVQAVYEYEPELRRMATARYDAWLHHRDALAKLMEDELVRDVNGIF